MRAASFIPGKIFPEPRGNGHWHVPGFSQDVQLAGLSQEPPAEKDEMQKKGSVASSLQGNLPSPSSLQTQLTRLNTSQQPLVTVQEQAMQPAAVQDKDSGVLDRAYSQDSAPQFTGGSPGNATILYTPLETEPKPRNDEHGTEAPSTPKKALNLSPAKNSCLEASIPPAQKTPLAADVVAVAPSPADSFTKPRIQKPGNPRSKSSHGQRNVETPAASKLSMYADGSYWKHTGLICNQSSINPSCLYP